MAAAVRHSRSQRLRLRRLRSYRRELRHRRRLRRAAQPPAQAVHPARGGRGQTRVVREADGDGRGRSARDDRRLPAAPCAAGDRLPHAARTQYAGGDGAGGVPAVRPLEAHPRRGRFPWIRRRQPRHLAPGRGARRRRDVRHGRLRAQCRALHHRCRTGRGHRDLVGGTAGDLPWCRRDDALPPRISGRRDRRVRNQLRPQPQPAARRVRGRLVRTVAVPGVRRRAWPGQRRAPLRRCDRRHARAAGAADGCRCAGHPGTSSAARAGGRRVEIASA